MDYATYEITKKCHAKKCECVSESTLLWKGACYLSKHPTMMCLARKKKKKIGSGVRRFHFVLTSGLQSQDNFY